MLRCLCMPFCGAASCTGMRLWSGALRQQHHTTAPVMARAGASAASVHRSAAGCWPGSPASAPFSARSIHCCSTVLQCSAAATSQLPTQPKQTAAAAGSDPEQAAADALAAWIQSIEPQPAQLVPRRIPGRGG